MISIERARALRPLIEQAAAKLDDQAASRGAELFPRLKGDGALIPAGTRINWQGTIKRAAVDLWDNAQSTPEAAANLWEDIFYREGWRVIPEVITAGLAFALGECGWWGDTLYRSLREANVHNPEQAPELWEVAEQGV